ncbi:MAG: alanine racemase [Deltaproteobacteria bacterium]|nr:alanine racemase [Deltaproteobacteria bacterium]
MTRIGIQPHDFSNLLHLILDSNSLELQSIMTHLARADEIEQQAVQNQIEIFHSLTQDLKNLPKKIPFYHIANSAALIKQKIQGTNMARPGIALYGAYPHPDMKELIDLKPVLSWKSKIISLKQVPAHTPISYGGTYVTTRSSKIAIMPVGYADGYSRVFSNIGEVLVRGHRAPVRGRVCMDLTMIDVTDIKNVALEDEVVLIGKQESQEIRAEELAAKTNTISYEIFTSISARVPRIIHSGEENS